ncbi:hypothetical protein GA0070216_108186 [Micromonospora matsumotoense]|uniref:Uncharacterized protein n=1 Tax=Micromonospora matsumotoense TaxID=121616 RepID=A0A1C4Z670_9ACTN|nr:hypothetical protein [Micromonospora matsumotoense]SCF28374.1 hypothetical protein GA0070216_108186 [Micromonospora matsumotoense]
MTSDELDHAIRSAASPVPARVTQARARELLESIVTTDRRAGFAPAAPRARRGLKIGSVATALAAGGAVIVGLVAGGPAYASWTPDPGPVSAAEARGIVVRCVPAQEIGVARIVVGETRGDYAYVNAVTPSGSRTCFRDHNGDVTESSILTVLTSTAQLGATGVELYAWSQLRTNEGYIRLMAGHLGSQITDVDITVRAENGTSSRTAHATVRDGYFAAWYPEGRDEASSNITTLTLRLTDGSTVGNLSAGQLYEHPKLD